MPGLVNFVCKISADFPPSSLNSSPQNTCTLQKCSQKFSFFTVFHYRKLTKRHCKQINLNPDWFFCYHDTIFTVRTKLKIFVQRFFFSLVYIFVVFVKYFQMRRRQSYQVVLVAFSLHISPIWDQKVPKNSKISPKY